MVRLSPLTFRVVGETTRPEETVLTSARDDRDHVGLFIQEAREALGREVDEIALALRIRPAHLQAIEDGRFGDLPGPTYAIGFIRTYADFLGLDGAAVVARFKGEALAYSTVQPELDFIATPEGRFPSGALILVVFLLAAGGFVGWSYLDGRGPSVVERVAEPPAFVSLPPEIGTRVSQSPQQAAAIETPTAPPSLAPTDALTGAEQPDLTDGGGAETAQADRVAPERSGGSIEQVVTREAPAALAALPSVAPATVAGPPVDDQNEAEEATVAAAPTTSSPRSAIAAEPGPEVAAPQITGLPAVPAVPAGREGGRAYGQANIDARIVLTATADSWVQVRDDRQNVLLTRMLQPGDTYRVPDRRGLTLLTGNAGGLRVEVDGTEVARLGPVGAVRRDIRLDPDALKLLAN